MKVLFVNKFFFSKAALKGYFSRSEIFSSIGQGLLLAAEAYWHKWVKSYDKVDLFISPSRFLADLVSKRISREKIRVIHNGIDLSAYCLSSNDDGYALYFGRLSKEKD
jgi:glycosyltransferase involved in cell wall biosynthesis